MIVVVNFAKYGRANIITRAARNVNGTHGHAVVALSLILISIAQFVVINLSR